MNKLLKNESGYTLIIVLWALVILSIIFLCLYDEVSLDNYVVRNDMTEVELKNSAVNAVTLAIYKLKNDETEYDSLDDQWTKDLRGYLKNGEIEYRITIEDIGSKLNINYTSLDILKNISWWNEDLEAILKDKDPVIDMRLTKNLFAENYQSAHQLFTTYGKFNVNVSRLESLKKVLMINDFNQTQVDMLVNKLKELRQQRKHDEKEKEDENNGDKIEVDGEEKENSDYWINSMDELADIVEGIDLNTVDELKKYMTTKGRYNINLVDEEILTAVLKEIIDNDNKREQIIDQIKTRRTKKPFETLTELQESGISEEEFEKLENHFTVSSRYFLIKVVVWEAGNKGESGDEKDDNAYNENKDLSKEIHTTVERSREGDKYTVEVLGL